MHPSSANMRASCLHSELDITQGLTKYVVVEHCPFCDRWLHPPETWTKAERESRDLLKFCIGRLGRDMEKVSLLDAAFVSTKKKQNSSMAFELKLEVQRCMLNGDFVQKSYVVKFFESIHLCKSCSRAGQWVAAVQLRQQQRVPDDRRSLFCLLEHFILKYNALGRVVRLKQMDEGVDFHFASRNHAELFVKFLHKFVPISTIHDKQLVSRDSKGNEYYQDTFSAEIGCVDSICLPSDNFSVVRGKQEEKVDKEEYDRFLDQTREIPMTNCGDVPSFFPLLALHLTRRTEEDVDWIC